MLVAAVVVAVVLVTVFGAVGPAVAGLGLLVAAVVLANPGGLGARVRRSPGWWGIPGMRRASAGALPFAGLLLLYSVPLPLGAFAMAHSGSGKAVGPAVAQPAPEAVGGGSVPTAPATLLFTPPADAGPVGTAAPTVAPTQAPASVAPPPVILTMPATPTPSAPAPPSPTPAARGTCGAPANPWNYNFCGGSPVTSAPGNFCDYFSCVASFWRSTKGYVDECVDGTYSHSGGRPGACSTHGGELRPLDQ